MAPQKIKMIMWLYVLVFLAGAKPDHPAASAERKEVIRMGMLLHYTCNTMVFGCMCAALLLIHPTTVVALSFLFFLISYNVQTLPWFLHYGGPVRAALLMTFANLVPVLFYLYVRFRNRVPANGNA